VTTAVLELSGVVKDYRALRPLRIAALSVQPGEHVALVGFDQVAAEVFTNLVTGAILPEAGDIRVFGRPTSAIADSDDWLATVDRFGIVSERAVLLDQLSVLQNLAMPFTLEIEPPPDEVKRQASLLAHEVGLPESIWEQPIAALSPSRVFDCAGTGAWRSISRDLEHASAGLSAEEATALGADIASSPLARTPVVSTLDKAFGREVADRILRWRRRPGGWPSGAGRWFRRLLSWSRSHYGFTHRASLDKSGRPPRDVATAQK
jgi:ABC-type iron transport system FetAB ATPase subunit